MLTAPKPLDIADTTLSPSVHSPSSLQVQLQTVSVYKPKSFVLTTDFPP